MKKFGVLSVLLSAIVTLLSSLASAQTLPKLIITFTDNSTNPQESGFALERANSVTGSFTVIVTLGSNITTYTDQNLAYSTQYCYRAKGLGVPNVSTDSPYSNVACGTTPSAPDATAPIVAITSPSSSGSFSTTSPVVTISGTASDNVGVVNVSWVNDRGGSGTATGTTSWSAAISLQVGQNIITVMAKDAAGNSSTSKLSVTYSLPQLNAPSGVTLSAISQSTVEATWHDNSTGETGQRLEWRSSSPPRTGVLLAAANVETQRISGFKKRTPVCVRLKAVSGSIESDPSNESCATTKR